MATLVDYFVWFLLLPPTPLWYLQHPLSTWSHSRYCTNSTGTASTSRHSPLHCTSCKLVARLGPSSFDVFRGRLHRTCFKTIHSLFEQQQLDHCASLSGPLSLIFRCYFPILWFSQLGHPSPSQAGTAFLWVQHFITSNPSILDLHRFLCL